MRYALGRTLGQEVVQLWHKDADLQGCELIVLPGGFSYGDYLRSGAIARTSPIMQKVIEHANNGGFVLGICNGFQILCESGLLPGALLHNDGQKFICKNQYIKVETNDTIFTNELKGKALSIPIAHGEGRFHADEEVLVQLDDNDQVLFTYCNADGKNTPDSNPNGSVDHIAGICNKKRNVFGMMPHPERAADERLGNTDGLFLLRNLCEAVMA
jgi:phosphoribosylformylglycinamidine synthase